jgi:hypothetical protein
MRKLITSPDEVPAVALVAVSAVHASLTVNTSGLLHSPRGRADSRARRPV